MAKASWIAFMTTTTFATAVLTWDRIVDVPVIGPGTEQRQLPPASQPSDDVDGRPASPTH
jgi:hypothetical protein